MSSSLDRSETKRASLFHVLTYAVFGENFYRDEAHVVSYGGRSCSCTDILDVGQKDSHDKSVVDYEASCGTEDGFVVWVVIDEPRRAERNGPTKPD